MATFVLDPNQDYIASVARLTRQFQRRQYRDKQFKGGEAEWKKRLESSSTVYVGNLSCYTNEYQLYELFARCGSIRRIIMGLDKIKKTPCGFCFVEYDERESARKSISYLNRTHLDGRDIQVDIDAGFEEGRQYGRGAHGGQISDERRRERESATPTGPRGLPGTSPVLTRSITVVACITMISLILIATQPDVVSSDISIRPMSPHRYTNVAYIRHAQLSENRIQFEKAFAQFLVNIMKQAKPTLLKAFIQATLADKQLKETALEIFFNNTSSSSNSGGEDD